MRISKEALKKYADGTTYRSKGKTIERVSFKGTKRGDNYCARSSGQKQTEKVRVRRKAWGCKGKKSITGLGSVKTYKDKYNDKYKYPKGTPHSLTEISKDTGISKKGLQKIYNKGVGAYKTNPSSVRPNVTSKEQWAMARVYSAVMGGNAAKVDKNELKITGLGKIYQINNL